ncbi:hypothetical protein SEMRO_2400_G326220.1 [Seminavis robusta]|uniref:Uncharacterized protein n=1 Tax=Seminavis robusta TaxID=568900 RepID=A0A9N8HZV9_9STRA|nr:hypothetical protein SEMRO_2400_G326220.1 [Seminavis robusta]|eukprot:Sro2400_g326220.1 n/a (307) ;mRNA; f:7232-8152
MAWYIQRRYPRSKLQSYLATQLPQQLAHRLGNLVSRQQALLIWKSKAKVVSTAAIRSSLSRIREYIVSTSHPWSAHIGFVIPRVHHIHSLGDASLLGVGGYSPTLQFWFDIRWSAATLAKLQLPSTDPSFLHINALEFIAIIVQLAAITTRLRSIPSSGPSPFFPDGRPHLPIVLVETDNTSALSWAETATSSSSHGQALLDIYSELLRLQLFGINAKHIKGEDNVLADYLSRPTNASLSFPSRRAQLLARHPSMTTWDYFHLSAEMQQLLISRLSSVQPVEALQLPATLGQFVPTASTTSSLLTL